MKLVLAELLRDLRHRLATYFKTAKAEGSSSRLDTKRDALLQNCQLWRLLQVRVLHHILGTSNTNVVVPCLCRIMPAAHGQVALLVVTVDQHLHTHVTAQTC